MRPSRPLISLFLASIVVAAAGCGSSRSFIVERERRYDPSEYARYESPGSATVTGRAFARLRGGDVLDCSEDSIYLFPATRYSEEWWQRSLVEGKYLTDPDPRSLAFTRTLLTDDHGRFRFRSLPSGDYFLVSVVRWKDDVAGVRRGDRGETVTPLKVANLGTRVHLSAGETVDVALEIVSWHRVLIDPPPLGPE